MINLKYSMKTEKSYLKSDFEATQGLKENYVRPETQVYNVQTEGILCASSGDSGTTATADSPTWGGSAGFGSVSSERGW